MVGEIVITSEGRTLINLVVSGLIVLPPYLVQLADALLTLDRYDEYIEEVTPLVLARLEKLGYIMSATGLGEAQEILFANRRR